VFCKTAGPCRSVCLKNCSQFFRHAAQAQPVTYRSFAPRIRTNFLSFSSNKFPCQSMRLVKKLPWNCNLTCDWSVKMFFVNLFPMHPAKVRYSACRPSTFFCSIPSHSEIVNHIHALSIRLPFALHFFLLSLFSQCLASHVRPWSNFPFLKLFVLPFIMMMHYDVK